MKLSIRSRARLGSSCAAQSTTPSATIGLSSVRSKSSAPFLLAGAARSSAAQPILERHLRRQPGLSWRTPPGPGPCRRAMPPRVVGQLRAIAHARAIDVGSAATAPSPPIAMSTTIASRSASSLSDVRSVDSSGGSIGKIARGRIDGGRVRFGVRVERRPLADQRIDVRDRDQQTR